MNDMQVKNTLYSMLDGKQHIVWDWNGTILDDVEHAVAVMNTLLHEHALPTLDRGHYREVFDFPVVEYYQRLGFDFDVEPFNSLCHRFVDRFMAGVPALSLVPSMSDVLMQLRSEDRCQSVLSATDQLNLVSMVSHFELDDVFQYVVGIDSELADSKIERGRWLIGQSQIPPAQTVIIGDTLHDLEVARALNIDAILLSHGHQSAARLRQHHHAVVDIET